MPTPKGQTNNPNGRPPKGQDWSSVLKRIGEEHVEATNGTSLTRKEAIARILYQEAGRGQSWAINAIMDRMDGKPRQAIDQTVQELAPPTITIVPIESQANTSPDQIPDNSEEG